jgi:hypothetical protein
MTEYLSSIDWSLWGGAIVFSLLVIFLIFFRDPKKTNA